MKRMTKALIALVLVAARHPLRDAVAGYFIFYDYLYDQGDEITVGEITGTHEKDWYALAYNKADMEFEEAHERAIATLTKENDLRAAGKRSQAE